MIDLAAYVLEPLHQEGACLLSRGQLQGQRAGMVPSLLVVAPVGDHPAPASLRRLEHEYALRAELDPAWAVRPLALVQHQGRPVLVLADPGGEPLTRLLGRPLALPQGLRVAIGLAVALGQLHGRGLIHKDIKPAHVFVNDATGQVWLRGFGIASPLPRERQAPAPPELIAGTLAYMAPEQTGRMNRSIDARSDLYTLGVTLYELLTGSLPFTASEPLEWVHCHIARQPVPPAERCKEVPGAVSAIIMKLLAKTAEDRYQTAAGLERDLRRCLAQWEAARRIDAFPLGAHDTPDRLVLPEKLYGRARAIDTLRAAFDRVVTSGRPELVLVSGAAGIGKSAVVHELHTALVPSRGLFAAGKFDQYKRDIPYATLAQALQSLIRHLLGQREAALREALEPNGRLMVDLVPALTLLIGAQPPVPELAPQDAQRRFQLVFRRFLGVFARPEHPLALFLDDLQWLDAGTLAVLEDLLTQGDVPHVLVIGAFRDNEVDAAHPLRRTLDTIRHAGACVQEIRLVPLARHDVGQLIAEALRCAPARVAPLAQLVHDKTAGNPFFALQFLAALADEGVLTFAHGQGCWSWDLERMHAKGYTDNVADLMVGKLHRLPVDTQEALQQLACLGHSAALTTLALVHGTSEEEVHAQLWEAVRHEVIERLDGAYRFLHDRVQEAAYSLIPEERRAAAHLRIGRLLAAHTPPEEREEAIFELVNQLNRGAALITEHKEREQLAEFNLMAGTRAKNSTAYASALTYLLAGAALVAEDGWERQHALAFSLEFHRAECEFLTGALAAAEERLTVLVTRAATTVEHATVSCLRMDVYTTLGQSGRAIAVGLDYLRRVGIDWSPHPTDEDVRRAYERIWAQLGSRTVEDLIELPLMSDPVALATLDVLTRLVPPARHTDGNLVALVICRAVNLSLERGNSDGSCFAYAMLGWVAGPHFGNYQAGLRFGQLGYDLIEQRGLRRFQAITYLVLGNAILLRSSHVRAGCELVRRAFEAANKIGDLTCAAYCCCTLNSHLLAAGDPLAETQREAEHGLAFAQQMRFGFIIDVISTQLGLIRTLRGLTRTFGSLDDEQFDERRIERRFADNPDWALSECWYWIRKLQARYVAGDYAAAVEAASQVQQLLWTAPSPLEAAEFHLYGALSHAACCDSAAADQRQQHVEALAAHHRQLAVWAEHGPEHFENRAALVGAEIARLEGRELDAMRLYERAIHSARANSFVHHEALAHERAGRFYLQRGFETAGAAHLRHARACYALWGADGKVRQLDQTYPHLREEPVSLRPTTTIEAPVEHLDLATVVKISQALSGEIVLEQLIDTLMTLAVEHAGAERGLLLLPHADALWIAAEATTGRDTVTVRLRHAAVSGVELPESVLHYVLRTQKPVLLDDAAAPGLFAADAYLRQMHVRSVLCLPLVKQARLIGVLYLENRLTSHVFTAARSAVLTLLASQAAIALENARLYADVQHGNRERAAAEEALRASEERYRTIVEAQTDLICRYRPDTTLTFVNEAYCRYFDRTREELLGTSFLLLLPEDTRPASLAHIQSLCDHPRVARYEHTVIGANGDIRWQQWVDYMILDAHGRLLEVQTVARDITEGKRAEQRLMAQYTVTQILAEAATLSEATPKILQAVCECLGWDLGALWSLDRQAGVLRCVEMWYKASVEAPHFAATSRASTFLPGIGLPGRVWASRAPAYIPDVVHDANFPRAPIAARGGLHTACGFPILLGGDVLGVMEFFSHEIRQLDQDLLAMMATIGSQIGQFIERKRAEEALRVSEASLAEGQQISHTGNWRWNMRTGEVRGSAEHCRIFGFDPAAGPRSHLRYRERVHPEDRPALVHILDTAIRDQRVFQHEYRIVLPDGVVKHVQLAGRPATDASGGLELAGTIMDITERKRAEEALRQAQAELAHVARLTTLGELTASIAHEINQPLGAMVNSANACVRWLAAQNLERAQQSAVRIVADGQRAADTITRIRALAQNAPAHKDWLDLNATIRDVLALARSEVHRHGVVVETHLAADVPRILGDRIQLQQVLLNLIMNAIEAMSGVGDGPRVLVVRSDPDAASSVLVTVRDSGPGLDPQQLDRLFEAFYTTKSHGLGLGLAISRRIIEAHGGRLWATANVPYGAVLQFTVPRGSEEEG